MKKSTTQCGFSICFLTSIFFLGCLPEGVFPKIFVEPPPAVAPAPVAAPAPAPVVLPAPPSVPPAPPGTNFFVVLPSPIAPAAPATPPDILAGKKVYFNLNLGSNRPAVGGNKVVLGPSNDNPALNSEKPVESNAVEICSHIRNEALVSAEKSETAAIILGVLGLPGVGISTPEVAKAGNTTAQTAGWGISLGASILLTALSGYEFAKSSGMWTAYGAANAALLNMDPSNPNSTQNRTLCGAAINAWATGRGAADSGFAGGNKSGGGK